MHHINDRDTSGAPYLAGITRGTEHDGVAVQYLIPLAGPDHGKHLPGGIVHLQAQGAGRRTYPTLHAHLDFLPRIHILEHLLGKRRIVTYGLFHKPPLSTDAFGFLDDNGSAVHRRLSYQPL
jgi:hypothetical protein